MGVPGGTSDLLSSWNQHELKVRFLAVAAPKRSAPIQNRDREGADREDAKWLIHFPG